MKKKIDEIVTAEKILEIVYKALSGGQFNYHVAKIKGKATGSAAEDVVETKLKAIDTKRLLEAVTALEKIINLKKKTAVGESEEACCGKVILPDVEFPENFGGDES